MYCKYCKYRTKDGVCTNKHLTELNQLEPELDNSNNSLIYSYNEGGWFDVEDYFGCIHWKTKNE